MFFFFQAEDGIRDTSVTGVQTCALPILYAAGRRLRRGDDVEMSRRLAGRALERDGGDGEGRHGRRGRRGGAQLEQGGLARSEERRVGKEWRCGWSGAD